MIMLKRSLSILLGTFIGLSSFATTSVDEIKKINIDAVDFNPQVDITQLSTECQNFINKALPQHNWSGGFIRVPENYANPEGNKILVFYYYNNPQSELSTTSPIVFFNGGPFVSYHIRLDPISKLVENYDTSSRKHTFVMIDQRGTGCSSPNMPQSKSINAEQISLYGSQGIAQDAEVVRMKLFGSKKWKVYAQSYGGFIAARYLEYFPRSISELHMYAPALYEKFSDFFWMRIKKQKEVVDKFISFYPNDHLTRAINKINSSEGQNYCVYGGDQGPRVCGVPLVDVVLANIGQGYGRGPNSNDVWDVLKAGMLGLINSDPQKTSESSYNDFINQVVGSSSFFHSPSINMVYALWAQEFPFESGNPDDDCKKAYGVIREQGLNTEDLLLDECRIIKSFVPSEFKADFASKYETIKGDDFLTQTRILKMIKRNTQMKTYLYTGELDTLVQKESLVILSQSKALNYFNFKDTGHAGWMFQPIVWKRLMDTSL